MNMDHVITLEEKKKDFVNSLYIHLRDVIEKGGPGSGIYERKKRSTKQLEGEERIASQFDAERKDHVREILSFFQRVRPTLFSNSEYIDYKNGKHRIDMMYSDSAKMAAKSINGKIYINKINGLKVRIEEASHKGSFLKLKLRPIKSEEEKSIQIDIKKASRIGLIPKKVTITRAGRTYQAIVYIRADKHQEHLNKLKEQFGDGHKVYVQTTTYPANATNSMGQPMKPETLYVVEPKKGKK